jgi:beclin 1
LKLTEIENAANDTLRKTEEERDVLQKELEELEAESKKLEEEEEKFWQKSNEFQLRMQAFHNERDSINMKYDHDAKQYEKLQETVVYNDTFCISHNGPFGTINGFRLGRLSSQPVSIFNVATWRNQIGDMVPLGRLNGARSMQPWVRRCFCYIL